MSQRVSLNFRQAAYAQETGRFPIALITFEHDDLASPVRISADPTERSTTYTTDSQVVYSTTSRGNEYIYLPVSLILPDDTEDGPGEIKLEIDNVSRELISTIRSIYTPPTGTLELVMDNDLDTVELQWPDFLLGNVTYDASVVTGILSFETLIREPFPAGSFTPSAFPGLF